MEHGLGLVREVERRRNARRDSASTAGRRHRSRAGRRRVVVPRWHQRARGSLCGGRRKKEDPQEPADHALGRSRGGFTTKIHLLCDNQGHPLHFALTAGQAHESTALMPLLDGADEVLLDGTGDPVAWPAALAGDKGYRADWIDETLVAMEITPVIPSKVNEDPTARPGEFDRQAYWDRNIVERLIGWLKECRRIFARFEKTAVTFGGMIKMAFIERYLRLAT